MARCGHLGVVAVGLVERVGFAHAHVHGEGLAAVRLGRVVGPAVMGHEVGEPRVGAGGVIGRVGEAQDVLVRADGETLDLAELGVLQLLAQNAEEVLSALPVVREG